MLKLEIREWYKVKKGQTIGEIADAFCVSARLLAKENGLKGEPSEGRVLRIPAQRGNLYAAREGDTKKLLCGSDQRFFEKNGTDILYPGMKVVL